MATCAAFFVVQHIKVGLPLLAGDPMPQPTTIDPLYAHTCRAAASHGRTVRIGFRDARLSFYLGYEAERVNVSIITRSGHVVRALAAHRYMRTFHRYPDGFFVWNGRESDGAIAPDGAYYFRITLLQQDLPFVVHKPVRVLTVRPHPVITSVSPTLLARGEPVTIRFTGMEDRAGKVLIYRLGRGKPRLVTSFATARRATDAVWNGTVHARPAPNGRCLIGLAVTNRACTTGTYPPRADVQPLTVTVR